MSTKKREKRRENKNKHESSAAKKRKHAISIQDQRKQEGKQEAEQPEGRRSVENQAGWDKKGKGNKKRDTWRQAKRELPIEGLENGENEQNIRIFCIWRGKTVPHYGSHRLTTIVSEILESIHFIQTP